MPDWERKDGISCHGFTNQMPTRSPRGVKPQEPEKFRFLLATLRCGRPAERDQGDTCDQGDTIV